MRPVVGIPCFAAERAGTLRPIYGNNQAYVRAIERAGGAPLLIPPLEDGASMAAIRDRLDGLLLTGGGDVDPRLYGEEPLPECGAPEPERDEAEIALTRWAIEGSVPVLGVCRGMQVLNIVRGGTLFQDLGTQRPSAARHDHTDQPRSVRVHEISFHPASRLAEMLGNPRQHVNSLHHQAVNRPGVGLEIVAWSEDGIAEALELADHPFALAVQYHPEELAVHADDEGSRRLFAAFVRACAARGA